MQNIHKHLTPDDFIIIVRPVREEEDIILEEGSWTGEVQVSIVTNIKETTLTESEFNGMVMEENSIIRDLVRTYAENNMIMPTPEEEPITHRVLTLDTDTEGNA